MFGLVSCNDPLLKRWPLFHRPKTWRSFGPFRSEKTLRFEAMEQQTVSVAKAGGGDLGDFGGGVGRKWMKLGTGWPFGNVGQKKQHENLVALRCAVWKRGAQKK